MPLESGFRIGQYEIVAEIGRGGMGEVYRARDTVLNRDVAIKVLPSSLALDPERLARLRREAQLLASLNHPNIAQVHGLEQTGPTTAIIMELVDGPTLADRIANGAMPLDEVLPIARQIADALIAAHEQGIIHRDLKPANVKVRTDGTVKVLDFGLAKSVDDQASDATRPSTLVTASPTITTPAVTQVGVILGTAAYMSPEQAKGRAADKRSDVWSFGCIVYEMLTAKRAFDGEDVGDTLAAVIRGEPDWSALPADLPRPLRAFIQGCLEKDRGRRVGHISTARFALDERTFERSATTPAETRPRTVWRRIVALTALAILVVAVTSAVWWWQRPPRPIQPVTKFSFELPEGQQRFTEAGLHVIDVSRDGTQIVYMANRRLFLRSMAEGEPRPIAGSEADDKTPLFTGPVFSPDGRSIAFWTGIGPNAGTIKKIAATGGTPVTICQTGFPSGMRWDADGILFGGPAGVMRVAESGGEPHLLLPVKDGLPWHPQILPDGDGVLFTLANSAAFTGGTEAWDDARIVVQSLKTGERTTLPQKGTDASYLPTGHIVYASAATLFAVPFDVRRRQVTGGPVPVVEGIRRPTFGRNTSGTAYYSISDTGSLIFVRGSIGRSVALDLAFVDRKGTVEPLHLRPADYFFPRAAPDGKRVAVQVVDSKSVDIWIHDLTGRASPQQLTFGGRNRLPVWSRDGAQVLFQSDREGDLAIFSQRADGSSPPQRLTKPDKGSVHIPRSWSRDARTVLFETLPLGAGVTRDARYSLEILSLPDGKVQPFGDVQSAGPINAVFSPDDRWVAYDVAEAPLSPSVYVQPFPPTGAKYLACRSCGYPAWSSDGQQLLSAGQAVLRVQTVIATQPFTLGNPVQQPRPGIGSPNDLARMYDLMPDGRIIGVVVAAGETGSGAAPVPQIQVVVNWFEELKRLAPAK